VAVKPRTSIVSSYVGYLGVRFVDTFELCGMIRPTGASAVTLEVVTFSAVISFMQFQAGFNC
jgi:hypothetical protein